MRTLLAVFLLAGGLYQQAYPSVAAEFKRLGRDIDSSLPEAERAPFRTRFERGRSALERGKVYLALYDLQPVYEAEAGYRLASEADKTTADAFKARWTEMGEPKVQAGKKAPVMFVEALAQSAEGRAPATYRASLPYSQDSGMVGGLYYLAESHAMIRFAALCRSIDLKPFRSAATFRPVSPTLDAYDARVVKTYDAAPIQMRPRYAQVNVAIKLARTLDESGRPEGALLQYLVSRFRFGMVQRDGTSTPPVSELTERLQQVKMPSEADHSILEFFVQLADATLASKDAAPLGAVVVLDDIVPAYLEMVKK